MLTPEAYFPLRVVISLLRLSTNQRGGQAPPATKSSRAPYFKFTNNCSSPVRLAIRYEKTGKTRNTRNKWVTAGWWLVNPGRTIFLTNKNKVHLQTKNKIWYYYAEATDDTGRYWGGDDNSVSFNGRTLNMKKKQDDDGDKNWAIKCD